MLYRAVRPLLFSMDAEGAHHVGLAGAGLLQAVPAAAQLLHRWGRAGSEPVRVAGLTFPHRVGLAAGLDKNAVAPLAWWAFGFGHVELGTITPRPQPGNDKPRLFRIPESGAIVNRMGFNNEGADAVATRLRAQRDAGARPPIPIGISIGKNKWTSADRAAEDYAQASGVLGPYADYLAVNISSPNTPGLRDLQSAEEVSRLTSAVRQAAPGVPVLIKLAPELAVGEVAPLRAVLEAAAAGGAAGIIATNTLSTANVRLLSAPVASTVAKETGGLSGRPIHEVSVRAVERIRENLPTGLALIGCGGISDAGSARRMLDAGADLIQLYSALIFEGPTLPARLSRALTRR